MYMYVCMYHILYRSVGRSVGRLVGRSVGGLNSWSDRQAVDWVDASGGDGLDMHTFMNICICKYS